LFFLNDHLGFQNPKQVQQFVSKWIEKKRAFTNKYTIHTCIGCCKVLVDIYDIDYSAIESTLSKTKVLKMVRPIFSYKLSSFQANQFKVIWNLYNDDWKDLSFKHAQILIQEMKGSTIEPTLTSKCPSDHFLVTT